MAATRPTYVDLANRLDEKDKIAMIIELLHDTNEILDDMVPIEGNLLTGHRTTVRTGLPSVTWRLLNYGVQPSKSQTLPITDVTGMLEAYAEVDKALADLNGNTAEFRLSEDIAFLESMNQEMASTIFYGNVAVDPEKFTGFAPRYASLSTDIDKSGYNIIDAGGIGPDNTSIWLIVWGNSTAHAIYPKGSKMGFTHEDLGQQTLTDAAGGRYEGYRTHYKWDIGLTVRDWRYVIRIANIDWSAIITDTSAPDLVKFMIDAAEQIPNLARGNAAFYMRREIRTALRHQIRTDTNVNLTVETVEGRRVLSFDEIPVRRVDALINTEARIT
ncbi:MAG: hypothetical protein E3J23_08680 [Candidatus Stahlbacteria bacterium]|nr:MAG: hypothetical protein E3J23_08680 [Candidatus Stahlbacteria bacterium]